MQLPLPRRRPWLLAAGGPVRCTLSCPPWGPSLQPPSLQITVTLTTPPALTTPAPPPRARDLAKAQGWATVQSPEDGDYYEATSPTTTTPVPDVQAVSRSWQRRPRAPYAGRGARSRAPVRCMRRASVPEPQPLLPSNRCTSGCIAPVYQPPACHAVVPQTSWENLGKDLAKLVDDHWGRAGARKSLQWAIEQLKNGKTDREKLGIDVVVDETYTQEWAAE
jgi:hypothetical protein